MGVTSWEGLWQEVKILLSGTETTVRDATGSAGDTCRQPRFLDTYLTAIFSLHGSSFFKKIHLIRQRPGATFKTFERHLLIEAAFHVPAHRHRGSSFKNKTRRLVRTNDKESNTQFSTGVFKFIKVVLQKKGARC